MSDDASEDDDGPRAQPRLVLLRHGESEGNAARRFTGWRDEPLSRAGVEQAALVGREFAGLGWGFDTIWTSCLQRAVRTADEVQRSLGSAPARHADWRLNERHCGAFQGRSKDECKRRFGADTVRAFREQWRAGPPPAAAGSRDDPRADARYRELPDELPRGESLQQLAARVEACWRVELRPAVAAGQRVLVVAHAISLRALLRPILSCALGSSRVLPEQLPAHEFANCQWRAVDFDGERARLHGA